MRDRSLCCLVIEVCTKIQFSKFSFGSYRQNIISILRDARTELAEFLKKGSTYKECQMRFESRHLEGLKLFMHVSTWSVFYEIRTNNLSLLYSMKSAAARDL